MWTYEECVLKIKLRKEEKLTVICDLANYVHIQIDLLPLMLLFLIDHFRVTVVSWEGFAGRRKTRRRDGVDLFVYLNYVKE